MTIVGRVKCKLKPWNDLSLDPFFSVDLAKCERLLPSSLLQRYPIPERPSLWVLKKVGIAGMHTQIRPTVNSMVLVTVSSRSVYLGHFKVTS